MLYRTCLKNKQKRICMARL